MRRQQITFLLSGLIAGLISVMLGTWSPVILAYGVGPLFFAAVVGGTAIAVGWRYVQASFLRFFAGLLLSTITYTAALFAFFVVAGSSQAWFSFRHSAHIADFRIDVWLGLIAAGAVGACGIAAVAAVLIGKWSNSLLLRLMLAGFLTIHVTFIANLPFHNDWSFFGVLLPLGNALFCYLVGAQIWQHPEVGRQAAATARTA